MKEYSVGISAGSIQNILHIHLNMHYLCQHLVPHQLLADKMYLDKNNMMALEHPQYFPDLLLSNFFLFS
jgi:hypothetical protein